MSTKNKPWLDNKGKPLSDEQLQIDCKNWGEETWNSYLKTIEVSNREDTVYVDADYFNSIDEGDVTAVVFNLTSGDDHPYLKSALKSCVMSLPKIQREVVSLHYWEGLSISQIASIRNVSKQSINKSLKLAIKKLHSVMTKGVLKKKVQIIKDLTAS